MTKFNSLTGGLHNSLHIAVGGRLHNEGAPLNTPSPFISLHEISDMYEYNFTDDFENVLIQFNIYSNTIPELNTLFGYMKTLFDNCSLSVSGYSHVYMRREQSYKMKRDDYYQRTVEYRILVEKS